MVAGQGPPPFFYHPMEASRIRPPGAIGASAAELERIARAYASTFFATFPAAISKRKRMRGVFRMRFSRAIHRPCARRRRVQARPCRPGFGRVHLLFFRAVHGPSLLISGLRPALMGKPLERGYGKKGEGFCLPRAKGTGLYVPKKGRKGR